MRVTIYLSSIQESPKDTKELRSAHTHCLLGLIGEGGLLLWDRRSRMQHQLSWAEIAALQKQMNEDSK